MPALWENRTRIWTLGGREEHFPEKEIHHKITFVEVMKELKLHHPIFLPLV